MTGTAPTLAAWAALDPSILGPAFVAGLLVPEVGQFMLVTVSASLFVTPGVARLGAWLGAWQQLQAQEAQQGAVDAHRERRQGRQRCRIHALLFRRGRRPLLRGPWRRLCLCAQWHAEQGGGDEGKQAFGEGTHEFSSLGDAHYRSRAFRRLPPLPSHAKHSTRQLPFVQSFLYRLLTA